MSDALLPVRVAAIDMGSNAFMCLVADVRGGKELKVVADYERVTRLGEGVAQTGQLIPQALERAKACLQDYLKEVAKHKAEKIVAVSTSAARDAQNSAELVKLGAELGIPIHIIDGNREANLSFEGTLSDLPEEIKKKILVVDVGGGSTEFIESRSGRKRTVSFNIGTLKLTEMFVKRQPVDGPSLKALQEHTLKTVSSFGAVGAENLVLVAGTPVALYCLKEGIKHDFWSAHGKEMTLNDVETGLEKLSKMTVQEISQINGLDPRRADMIVAGCVILEQTMKHAKLDRFRISVRGLRYGVALHHEEFTGSRG